MLSWLLSLTESDEKYGFLQDKKRLQGFLSEMLRVGCLKVSDSRTVTARSIVHFCNAKKTKWQTSMS